MFRRRFLIAITKSWTWLNAALQIFSNGRSGFSALTSKELKAAEDSTTGLESNMLSAPADNMATDGNSKSEAEGHLLDALAMLHSHKDDYATDSEANLLDAPAIIQNHRGDQTTENETALDLLAAKIAHFEHQGKQATETDPELLAAEADRFGHQGELASDKDASILSAEAHKMHGETDSTTANDGNLSAGVLTKLSADQNTKTERDGNMLPAPGGKLNIDTGSATEQHGALSLRAYFTKLNAGLKHLTERKGVLSFFGAGKLSAEQDFETAGATKMGLWDSEGSAHRGDYSTSVDSAGATRFETAVVKTERQDYSTELDASAATARAYKLIDANTERQDYSTNLEAAGAALFDSVIVSTEKQEHETGAEASGTSYTPLLFSVPQFVFVTTCVAGLKASSLPTSMSSGGDSSTSAEAALFGWMYPVLDDGILYIPQAYSAEQDGEILDIT